jgi:hypothetical protein
MMSGLRREQPSVIVLSATQLKSGKCDVMYSTTHRSLVLYTKLLQFNLLRIVVAAVASLCASTPVGHTYNAGVERIRAGVGN